MYRFGFLGCWLNISMSLQILWITLVTFKNKNCIYYDCHFFLNQGSARRLIKAALQGAARKREMRYSDLTKIDKKVRRHFHDDITVIVLFINYDLLLKGAPQGQPLSIRCALDYWQRASSFSGVQLLWATISRVSWHGQPVVKSAQPPAPVSFLFPIFAHKIDKPLNCQFSLLELCQIKWGYSSVLEIYV